MLVTRRNFDAALKAISESAKLEKFLSYDTETMSLHWWDSPWYTVTPRVFSIQIATRKEEFYFDFLHSDDHLSECHFEAINNELTQNPETIWAIHNAPFDLHQSRNHDIEFAGTIHCTQAQSRVAHNLEMGMSLDVLAEKYLGHNKIDVKSKLIERGHFSKIKKFGRNDKEEQVLHYDRLELTELVEYGTKDARLCFDLGVLQIKRILDLDDTVLKDRPQKLKRVMINEQKLTKVLFEMEREGVKIDRAYTERAYNHEIDEYIRIEAELNQIAGSKVDWLSAKQLKPVFEKLGEPYSYTEKGNASFDRDALEDSSSDLAKLILKYRYHYKRAHTYFENFIWFSDRNDVLHANIQQSGTQFARMSSWNPNLYNIPKRRDKEESSFKVRECFVPKPGKLFADIDYKGAEYRMAMDYARETQVVDEIKNGLDPHERLGREMNLDRTAAKTMQFRILYGGGQEVVGRALGFKGAEAQRIGKEKKAEYFERVPRLAELLRAVSFQAATKGFIVNWLGRVLRYDRQTGYKAPNGLFQSGVGDLTKVALVQLDETLRGTQTKMLLQVYDAILFEMPASELHLIPKIKDVMNGIYLHKCLPMDTDVGYSSKSWSDLKDEPPAA